VAVQREKPLALGDDLWWKNVDVGVDNG